MAIPPSSPQGIKIIQAIAEQNRINLAIKDMRLQALSRREECMLSLSSALLRLNTIFGLSWRQIADGIDGICDSGHAHKIAHRLKYVSKNTYNLATASINRYLEDSSCEPIDFPVYPDSLR